MTWDWFRQRPLLVDAMVVVVLLATSTIDAANQRSHLIAGVVLGVAGTLPLLRRRQQPLLVVVLVTAVALAMTAFGVGLWPLQLGLALYTLASIRTTRTASFVGLASILSLAIALPHGGFDFGDFVAARVVFLVVAWLVGGNVASRRAYVREIEVKAERFERERESEARRMVAEEQARIARELHDVIAHALSVIVLQAGAADDVYEVDPRRTRAPIRAIDAAARTALADLRRVLGVLHHDPGYEPQPSLDRLELLIEQVRATGLKVSFEIEGAARPLPAAIELSAYRIVQEALTNTLRHADAGQVLVRIRYGDQLALEVRDDGQAEVNGGNGGRGLIGMRQRVLLLGGTVEAGPTGGGYSVCARIPIDHVA